jgi:hypothetical protein
MSKTNEYLIKAKDNFDQDTFFSAPDIFKNTLDITWMATSDQNKDYTSEYTILPVEPEVEDDGEVLYQFNKQGFRSDNFISSHEGTHILFAGCSQTEGVGSPLETVWTKMLYEDIKGDNNLSGFFSLGRSGYGWQKIIANFLVYSEKYGMPDIFLVQLPNIGREWKWHKAYHKWFYVQRYPTTDIEEMIVTRKPNPDDVDFFKHTPMTVEEHRKAFIDFCAGWTLFEKFCESNNVKLLWGTWDEDENINHKLANISQNYIHFSREEFLDYLTEVRPDGVLKKHDVERRDGHLGILNHEYWRNKFLEEMRRRHWVK